jgi:hypothetical protein
MTKPEDIIAELGTAWRWPIRPCLATDPVIEYAIDRGDPALRNQLVSTYLETTAAAYRAMADGASKAANIAAGGKKGG